MEFVKKILVPSAEADTIEKYLSNEVRLGEDETVIYTAKFTDGVEVDVKCCGTHDEDECAWTEAVLFVDGTQFAMTEVEDDYFGEWRLEYDGDDYVVIVEREG